MMNFKANLFQLIVLLGIIYFSNCQTIVRKQYVLEYNSTANLNLVCESESLYANLVWFKSYLNGTSKPLTDITPGIIDDPTFFSVNRDENKKTTTLTLLKPNWTDIGIDVYFALALPLNTTGCYISLYLYQTKMNDVFSHFTIYSPITNEISFDTLFPVQLSSVQVAFPFYLQYYFNMETFPLNRIFLNGSSLPTIDCKTNTTRTYCLSSNSSYYFPFCQDSATLFITYGFDDPNQIYNNITSLIPYNQTIILSFRYPPTVTSPFRTVFVDNLQQNVTLSCDTFQECGTPSYEWVWGISNATIPKEINKTITLFPNLTSSTASIDVKCIVSKSGATLKSSTVFTIKLKSGLLDWEIALIVVGSVLAVALIIVTIFLIWKFCIKSSETAVVNKPPTKTPPNPAPRF